MSEKHDTSDPARWQRLNEIFAAAREVEPEEQAELFQTLCGGDQELRREAEEILAASLTADKRGFLKADVFADGARVLVANEIPRGTIIGPYRVVRELG